MKRSDVTEALKRSAATLIGICAVLVSIALVCIASASAFMFLARVIFGGHTYEYDAGIIGFIVGLVFASAFWWIYADIMQERAYKLRG